MVKKKHLEGGTLRTVMAEEIKRVMKEEHNADVAAVVLGVAPRTLRIWIGPVEKGGWEELQVKSAFEHFEAVMGGRKKKKGKVKKGKMCHDAKAATAVRT